MKKLEKLIIERNEILKKLNHPLSPSIEKTNKMMLKLINIIIKLERKKNDFFE